MTYPTHAVVDMHDGYTWTRDRNGEFFTADTAADFAQDRNDEMKPEHRLYRVATITVQAPLLDDLDGWGWSRGVWSYGELRDMLAGVKGWDLSTSREGLEKLIHEYRHTGRAYSCPACKAERNRP